MTRRLAAYAPETSSMLAHYMLHYYVSRKPEPNGNHVVHRADFCPMRAGDEDQLSLGLYSNHEFALQAAKRHFPQATGCAACGTE